MNPCLKSWQLAGVTLTLIINFWPALASEPTTPLTQQRTGQPYDRSTKVSSQAPAGSQTLPEGTLFILRMKTRLNSGSSRVSDRFTAQVAEPLLDQSGRMLVPVTSLIEGHVAAVTPAQYRRRSGIIAVSFDRLRLADGRAFPVSGMLTSADSRERQRIDQEGNVAGGSTLGSSVVFIGGGATSGAVIGTIAGSALVGAGVGAAAGVVGALLAKGKEAVVEPGTQIGLKLLQPLDLSLGARGGIIRLEPGEPGGSEVGNQRTERDDIQQLEAAVPVRVTNLQVGRAADGSVRVLITAETETAGWRVYADHSVDRDTLEIWLRGVRPNGMAAQVISHPTVTLSVPDEAGAIRRVLVHGADGDRAEDLPARPGLSASSFPELTARVADKLDVLLTDYAASVGATRTGETFEFTGERRPSESEVGLLFALSNLADSARLFRSLAGSRLSAEGLRGGALRLSFSAQEVNRLWPGLRLSDELEKKWRAIQEEIRLISDAVTRS